jgi:hypothetical protein
MPAYGPMMAAASIPLALLYVHLVCPATTSLSALLAYLPPAPIQIIQQQICMQDFIAPAAGCRRHCVTHHHAHPLHPASSVQPRGIRHDMQQRLQLCCRPRCVYGYGSLVPATSRTWHCFIVAVHSQGPLTAGQVLIGPSWS